MQFLMIAIIIGMSVTATVFGADLPSNRTKLAKDSEIPSSQITGNFIKLVDYGSGY